jgi:DNA-directed RNA polymerase specialized sigma24 family protein
MTNDLWLRISNIAHALAVRHGPASYYRPQYIGSLLSALDEPEFSHVKQVVEGDLIGSVEAQCATPVPDCDRDALWSAFGVERCAPGVAVLQRSRATRSLGSFLSDPALPISVAAHAKTLQETTNPFGIRVLGLGTYTVAARLYRNPLDQYRSLLALCEWRLTKDSEDVATLQGWVSNVVYHQLRYRVVTGQIESGAFDDIVQDVALRTLQQLAIYQPHHRTSLTSWTFNMINQSISMSGRSLRRERNHIAIFTSTPDNLQAPALNSEEASEAEAAELVEYTMTRLRASGSQQKLDERIRTFVAAIPHLLGGEPPQTLAELEAQLRLLLPNIDSEHIYRIGVHSGLIPDATEGAK